MPIVILPANQNGDDPNKVFTINFSYYNKVYMQPWYWVGIYSFGSFFGQMYQVYLKDKEDKNAGGPVAYLNNLRTKWTTQALNYGFGLAFVLLDYFRSKRFVESA